MSEILQLNLFRVFPSIVEGPKRVGQRNGPQRLLRDFARTGDQAEALAQR
jgi:hypothetical protein